MSRPAARSVASSLERSAGGKIRAAFVGPRVWLDGCAPPERTSRLISKRFEVIGRPSPKALEELSRFGPDVTVVLDPLSLEAEPIGGLSGATLGVLCGGAPPPSDPLQTLSGLDRIISFDPALTGTVIGPAEVWRGIPPPVADTLYAPVRALHGAPRAMSIGRSTSHRESMLMPAKHHHDLLQLIHGVSGEPLRELLGEYDVGVHVAPDGPGGFGQQVALHLAAGQLLMSTALAPAHGLEREIDYLQFDSAEGLVWTLERLGRFPEMYQRIRVRGRLKAEQYRASRLFDRLLFDLLADVTAFGRAITV